MNRRELFAALKETGKGEYRFVQGECIKTSTSSTYNAYFHVNFRKAQLLLTN